MSAPPSDLLVTLSWVFLAAMVLSLVGGAYGVYLFFWSLLQWKRRQASMKSWPGMLR